MKNPVSAHSLKIKRLAVCGILSAIGIVFLMIGVITDVLDLSMLMLASFCIVFAVIEIGTSWAWLVYGVTAVLSLLLLPSKLLAVLYLMSGMYPIGKAAFEKLHPVLAWILKFSMFNTIQIFYILVAQKLFGMSGADYSFAAGVLLLNNAIFLVYDFALTVFISFYLVRLRRRIHFPSLR